MIVFNWKGSLLACIDPILTVIEIADVPGSNGCVVRRGVTAHVAFWLGDNFNGCERSADLFDRK